MAAGMTLNQLYATPPSSSAGPSGSVPTPSTSAPASSSTSAATPPQGRSPGISAKMQPQSQMDRAYQMPYPQPPPLQTQPQPQYGSYGHSGYGAPMGKTGPSTSEDYAADPLPFEYNGLRKFHRDPSADGPRGLAPVGLNSSAGYAPQPQPQPAYVSARPSPYSSGPSPYPEPRGSAYHHDLPTHFPRAGSQSMYMCNNPMLPLPGHNFPSLLDNHVVPKKEESYPQSQSHAASGVYNTELSGRSAAQEAVIKVKTPLKLKYWRNGRRNLQCFPSCKVFGDYSAIKIEDLKQHDFMWGKCRGSLVTEVTLNRSVAWDDLVLLGRVHSLENIPVAFEEAVIRECMLGRVLSSEELDGFKDSWISGERLPDFAPQEGNVACFEFKPKVWKYTEDMAQGKCKRRNVKYYVQFEAFVPVMVGDTRGFACIGSGMSTAFEVGSSRVLARQKRKAAENAKRNGTSQEKSEGDGNGSLAVGSSQMDLAAMQQQQQPMLHGMMHSMMPTPMYPPPGFHHQEGSGNRALPPTFPHPQSMPQIPPQMQSDMHYSMPPQTQPLHQEQQQEQSQAVVGGKRKLSSERPAFPTDRAAKMLKPMGGVAQSVPF